MALTLELWSVAFWLLITFGVLVIFLLIVICWLFRVRHRSDASHVTGEADEMQWWALLSYMNGAWTVYRCVHVHSTHVVWCWQSFNHCSWLHGAGSAARHAEPPPNMTIAKSGYLSRTLPLDSESAWTWSLVLLLFEPPNPSSSLVLPNTHVSPIDATNQPCLWEQCSSGSALNVGCAQTRISLLGATVCQEGDFDMRSVHTLSCTQWISV